MGSDHRNDLLQWTLKFFRDREINKATYPALHYPECYLLHDGYKAFYEAYPQLCVGSYLPMKHPQFAHEERKFHKKSKSWAAGGGGTISRTGASSRLLKLWQTNFMTVEVIFSEISLYIFSIYFS